MKQAAKTERLPHMKARSLRFFLLLGIAVANCSLFTFPFSLFTSCEAEAPVSRKYVCRFVFNYRDHATSLLFAAAQNPGTYVYVTTKGDGKTSVRHVYVNSNDDKTPQEDNVISSDLENYSSYVLGASNSIGLFIGTTNFNGLWAYDRACPNCTSLQAMNFTGNRQQVLCPRCQRTYELETGAIINGDEGSSLMRYYCSFDGSILRAWN